MINVKVEKTKTGFSAYAAKYSAFTTGKTVVELVTNMVESLTCTLKRPASRRSFPQLTSGLKLI